MRILVTRVLMTEIGQTNLKIRSRNTEFCIKRLCNFVHANADTLLRTHQLCPYEGADTHISSPSKQKIRSRNLLTFSNLNLQNFRSAAFLRVREREI